MRDIGTRWDRRCLCCRQRPRAGRKLRYNLRLPPGSYNTAPAWASRRHWLDVVLGAAIVAGREVLRRHHIAPVTFLRVMAMHAMHADDATGRGCTIDVDHLRLEAGCSERTVQRARAAARELGVATEVHRGRHLTLQERIEAYDRGSKQRGFASVYALGCPAWLAPRLPHRMEPVPNAPQVTADSGERGTPPVGRSTRSNNSRRSSVASATSAEELAPLAGQDKPGGATAGIPWPAVRAPGTAPPRRRPSPSPEKRRWRQQHARGDHSAPRAGRRRPSYSPDAIRLATAVRRHVPALRHTPLGRLVPAHTRFACAEQPWTAEALVRTAYGVARVKGWTVQAHKVRTPAAWWAGLLDGIDPVGRPSGHLDAPVAAVAASLPDGCATFWEAAARDERQAVALREQHRERQLEQEAQDARAGRNLCEHGASGADPATSRSPRCALCRYG